MSRMGTERPIKKRRLSRNQPIKLGHQDTSRANLSVIVSYSASKKGPLKQKRQAIYTIGVKALITLAAAIAVGAGVGLFTIARQDGSKSGQVLGIVIPIVAIISAIYLIV
jgi:hypothetical protein